MLKHILKIIIILAVCVNLYAIDIDEKTSQFDILSKSYIFLDKNGTFTKSELTENYFVKNDKEILGFGFVEKSSLWIKFSLKNTTGKPLIKFLEYDNPETEDILFFDGKRVVLDGMFHVAKNRKSVNPSFVISLQAYEQRDYYIKAHCKISTLIAKLTLWNQDDFIRHVAKHKMYIAIFFTVIITLFLYNFMLLVFTKDKAYFYYILYLAGMLVFQSMYLGIAQLYILSNALAVIFTKATFTYISFLVIPILLFTREFLNLQKFQNFDKVLKIYFILIPVLSLLTYDNIIFNLDAIIVFIPLGIVLVWASIYTFVHGEQQAKFYIVGWTFVIVSLVLSVLKSLGGFDASQYFVYFNEVAFSLEALLFSIALAHRIKLLSEEKNKADAKLIEFQKTEQIRLEKLLNTKTAKLKVALSEKELLYKELNHRVKNNIQMILSLVKLQISKTSSLAVKKELETTKNRIYSMWNLYETFNLSSSEEKVNTGSYIRNIVENIKHHENIDTIYDIRHELGIEKLLYVGLIVNEIVTNAMKYAFEDKGNIFINLHKKDDKVILTIKDDGVGFESKKEFSLGLSIVKTLVTKQLLGTMTINSDMGTVVTVNWIEI